MPTRNYVSHYDPAKSHHRAWLQAVLDRLGIACPMVRSSSLDIDPALRGQQHILAIARLLERLCSEDPESIRADAR